MANTPLAPPPAPVANNGAQPQAPVNQPAVIAPAETHSALGNDDQWNELEQQVTDVFRARADQAEQRATDSTGADTGAVISPADQGSAPVETEPPPEPVVEAPPVTDAPPVPPVAAPAPAPVETGLPGPVPGETPAFDPFALPAPPPDAPVQPVAQPAPQSLPAGYVEFMGQQMPIQEAQVMKGVYEWAQALTPEESNAINAFIEQRRTGSPAVQPGTTLPVQPTPAQSFPQPAPSATYSSPIQQPQSPGAVAAPPAPPAPPVLDPTTVDDPALAQFLNQQQQWFAAQAAQQQAIIQQQQQQLAQVQATAQSATQYTVEQQQAENLRNLDQARWDFAVRYSLTAEEMATAEARLAQSNLAPVMVDRRNGDVYNGVLDGLETVVWTDPVLRARLLAQQQQPAITDARGIQERAAKVGALGGSGGTVPAPTAPVSQQDRHAAMVAEIRAAQDANPS